MNPVRIAFSADENYVIGMAASVRSAIDTIAPGVKLQIAIMSCGIRPDSRELLLKSWKHHDVDIFFIDIDPASTAKLPTAGYLTDATYARLFLPDLLPQDWNRVIYLDVDTICRASLHELWETDLEGLSVGAVWDNMIPFVSSYDGVQAWKESGLRPYTPYFNAGVLVIDLDAWRRHSISSAVVDYVQSHLGNLVLWDQEGLNAVLRGKFCHLDRSWNVMQFWARPEVRLGVDRDVVMNARIRHFNGPGKPWTKKGHTVLDSEIFFLHLDRTEWAGWRPGP